MMTVADMIIKLKTLPQDLPVCVADWNEEYLAPSEKQAEEIEVKRNQQYHSRDLDTTEDRYVKGDFVQIGSTVL
jgi:hypothetical protein